MTGDYEDIDIVDLDVAKTTWSRVHASMRTVYLKLSREPEPAWSRYFFEERGKRINPRRHGLWIEDGYIVIDCFVDEVESHQLPDIRRSVEYASRKSGEQAGHRREGTRRSREEADEERRALDGLRERIRARAGDSADEASASEPEPAVAASDAESDLARKRSEWKRRFRAAFAASGESDRDS